MPQPYDYTVAQPDVGTYFQAMKAGREDRAVQQAEQRSTALSKYLPQALEGDPEARTQAMSVAGPEQMIQLKNTFMSMDAKQLEDLREKQGQAASLALWADTPEKWAIASQQIKALIPNAPDLPFEQRGAQIAKGQTVKEMLEQTYREKMLANDTRRTDASVAQSYAAADASRRAASESTGMGDEYSTDDPFAGLSAKARERLVIQNTKDYNAVAKENDKEMQGARAAMNDAGRFISLSRQVNKPGDLSTGTGWLAGLPGVRQVQTALDSRFSEMDAITARLVPKLREPGSGATSDFDAKMFQRGTIDIGKPGPANEAIALGMKAGAQNLIDKAGFEEAYFKARRTLVGAQDAWQQYLEANPIFDPGSQDMPKLNPSRASWRQHFGAGSQQQPAAAAAPPPPASNNPPLVRSKGEFDALPSGTVYREPDGKVYRKP